MAVGEFISVSSQKDSEMADIEKERLEQAKGAPNTRNAEEKPTGLYIHMSLFK